MEQIKWQKTNKKLLLMVQNLIPADLPISVLCEGSATHTDLKKHAWNLNRLCHPYVINNH